MPWPCAWPSHELRRGIPLEAPAFLLGRRAFSELDAHGAAALVELLPAGQVLLTTAVDPNRRWSTPAGWSEVADGRLSGFGRPSKESR